MVGGAGISDSIPNLGPAWHRLNITSINHVFNFKVKDWVGRDGFFLRDNLNKS